MSKLFNLKEWLTVAETTAHLSIIFNEEICEADVLRLALDGKLQLSVYFLNHANARCGRVVGEDEVEWVELQPLLKNKTAGKKLRITRSVDIGNGRFINLDDEVVKLTGIWDLPMIGNERLDIEHKYQILTDGPEVTLQGLDGTFVNGTNDVICQLQESYDSNEYQSGSMAAYKKIKEYIAENDLGERQAKDLLDKHQQQRKEYQEAKRLRNRSEDFYPAGGLPEDAVLVVRTDALREFEDAINQGIDTRKEKDPLSESERNSLLKLVLGMAIAKYEYDPKSTRNPATGDNKGSISSDLERCGLGMDSDTVRKYLKEAQNLLGDIVQKPKGH